MPRPRKYPPELLDRGARLVFESGRPIAQVARDLGLHPEALRKWVLSGAFRRQRSSVHESGGTPDLYGGIAERALDVVLAPRGELCAQLGRALAHRRVLCLPLPPIRHLGRELALELGGGFRCRARPARAAGAPSPRRAGRRRGGATTASPRSRGRTRPGGRRRARGRPRRSCAARALGRAARPGASGKTRAGPRAMPALSAARRCRSAARAEARLPRREARAARRPRGARARAARRRGGASPEPGARARGPARAAPSGRPRRARRRARALGRGGRRRRRGASARGRARARCRTSCA